MICVHVYGEGAVVGQNFMDRLVISITSPGREHVPMHGTNIHRFHFHDVTQRYDLDGGRIILPMEESIAEQIAEVAWQNRDKDRWIINCEAGVSRSPGVAIGLAKHLAMRPNVKLLKKMFPMYNLHVAKLVGESMRKRMERGDLN